MTTLINGENVCSVCEAEPDDMLILGCKHNLCLDCATEVYNLNSREDKIVCEICLSDTRLDEQTIVCLRSLSAKSINQQKTSQQRYEYQAPENRQNLPPIPRSTYTNYQHQQLPLIQQEAHVPRCQKHNEPLTYYCLECNFFKICSQCMLLQNHRYHKVITLKKASVQIKDTIQKIGREKLKLKNMLQKDKQSLVIRKQESQKQLQINVSQLKTTFEQISKLIMQRYQHLRQEMQQDAHRKLQIMQGAINQIQQKITLIDQTITFQDELIRSAMKNQNTSNTMFQMFEYYQSQMNQNKIDFEPRLPNYISQVVQQQLTNKENVFGQLELLLEQLSVSSSNVEEQLSDQNINFMSQIENDNIYVQNQMNSQKQKRNQFSMKKSKQQENYVPFSEALARKPISENINIIQLSSAKIKQRKEPNINIISSKKSKQTIQAIKRKARQNLKDKQLSQSRKMQLSRSIQNATDILNKIQQRSSRI